MTIAGAKKEIIRRISHLYEQREATHIAQLLVEKIMGLSRLEQILQKDTLLNTSAQQVLTTASDKLQNGEPIQYVIGEAWFRGHKFHVTPATLIPRPETEELVQWVIDDHQSKNQPFSVLDIGTGTGCIPISIGKELRHAKVYGIDISEAALAIAKKNALAMDIELVLQQIDFLNRTTWALLPAVEIIVSNPPYIAEKEKASMHVNVLAYEPSIALFVPDNDPLIFYIAIAAFAAEKLNKDGSIYVELNEQLGEATKKIFNPEIFETTLRKDLQGKDRMLRVVKK